MQLILVKLLYVFLIKCNLLVLRDPKDPAVTRVRLESLVSEDRRDTEASLVCRVCPDLRYVSELNVNVSASRPLCYTCQITLNDPCFGCNGFISYHHPSDSNNTVCIRIIASYVTYLDQVA